MLLAAGVELITVACADRVTCGDGVASEDPCSEFIEKSVVGVDCTSNFAFFRGGYGCNQVFQHFLWLTKVASVLVSFHKPRIKSFCWIFAAIQWIIPGTKYVLKCNFLTNMKLYIL